MSPLPCVPGGVIYAWCIPKLSKCVICGSEHLLASATYDLCLGFCDPCCAAWGMQAQPGVMGYSSALRLPGVRGLFWKAAKVPWLSACILFLLWPLAILCSLSCSYVFLHSNWALLQQTQVPGNASLISHLATCYIQPSYCCMLLSQSGMCFSDRSSRKHCFTAGDSAPKFHVLWCFSWFSRKNPCLSPYLFICILATSLSEHGSGFAGSRGVEREETMHYPVFGQPEGL